MDMRARSATTDRKRAERLFGRLVKHLAADELAVLISELQASLELAQGRRDAVAWWGLVMRSVVSDHNHCQYGRFDSKEQAEVVGQLLLQADKAGDSPEWGTFEVVPSGG